MKKMLMVGVAVLALSGWAGDGGLGSLETGKFFVGCNYWASHAGVRMWSDWRPQEVEKDLDAMAAQGMTVIRVFPLWPDFQPLTAEYGGGQGFVRYMQAGEPLKNAAAVDEEMMNRFRFLCDAAEKRNLRLVVGLITGFMSSRTFVPPALERVNCLADAEAIRWEVRFVRHFVKEMKDHRAIAAWDLGNECNCIAAASQAQYWCWVNAIAGAIRLEDPTRAVVSGTNSGNSQDTHKNTFRLQGELVDVLTTHPYPLWTPSCNTEPFDTLRNGIHAACESVYAEGLGGKPCIVEEAGSMGPQITGEDHAAAAMRMAMFNCWAAGLGGYMWWCGFDQDKLEFSPYDWTAIERELGLFESDRKPKPTVIEMRKFAEFIKTAPELPARQVDAIVVVTECENGWKTSLGAWMLAKQAGFDIAYAGAEGDLPRSDFYILPSGDKYNTYTRTAFWRVMDRAKEGATVLITLGDGAVLSDLEEVAGVHTENHYKSATRRKMEFVGGTFEIADSHMREISVAKGTRVIAADSDGKPAMTEFKYGKGKVLFFAGALEKNADLSGWPAYSLAAERAGVKRVVKRKVPSVCVTEHPRKDGSRVVVAVNCEPKAVECPIEVKGKIGKAYRGRVTEKAMEIGANDAAVFEVE